MKKLVFSACLLGIAVSCSQDNNAPNGGVDYLPYYLEATFTPYWATDTIINEQSHRIAPFSFTNQYGDTVTEQQVEDHIYVADFIYTSCPGICPKLTRAFEDLQAYFIVDNEVLLLSHSVLPEEDTPEILRLYGEQFSAIKSKWHLLTGNKATTYQLARNSYFAEEESGLSRDSSEFLHTERLLLIDKQRRIRGVYNGLLPLEITRLKADIGLLKRHG